MNTEFQNLILDYFAEEGDRDKKGKRKTLNEYLAILEREKSTRFTYAWKLGDARGFFINSAIGRFSNARNWRDLGITAELVWKSFTESPTSESELSQLQNLRLAVAEQVQDKGIPEDEGEFRGFYKTLYMLATRTHHKAYINKPLRLLGKNVRLNGHALEVKVPEYSMKTKDEIIKELLGI